MKRTNVERVRAYRKAQVEPVRIDAAKEDPAMALMRHMLGGPLLPTQAKFALGSEPAAAYMGPAGCAKTATIGVAALSRALWQPGSRGLVARYDYNDLMGTTADDMQRMLNNLPEGTLMDRNKSAPMEWWINPIGGGEPSHITFMGLKDNKGSYKFNWAIVDEADECDQQAVQLVQSRLRAPGGNYRLMIAFNPPDKHHWLYTACTGRDFREQKIAEPWLAVYLPQPNENAANLPPDYYQRLEKGLAEDQIQRLVRGEWGSTFEGQPVYREFKYGWHAKDNLSFDRYRPLYRFWDFGYNAPYCGFAQTTWNGGLRILAEVQGSKIEATPFIKNVQAETTRLFPDADDIFDYGDPAVAQHKDTGQTLAVFARAGITMRYRRSNIEMGVKALRELLGRTVEGDPAFLIDRQKCPILIAALRGGYRLDDKGQKPVKDNYYDHSADALRYLIVNVFYNGVASGPGSSRGGGGFGSASYVPESIEYSAEDDR